jgi:hypothetical protein
MKLESFFAPTLGAIVACGALACSDSTSPAGGRPMTISFSTAAPTGASLSSAADASREVSTASGSDALVITKAQLVVARIELQRVGATCTSTEATGDDAAEPSDDCAELQIAPSIVDLPVNGTVASALSVAVPTGSYSALEAKILPLGADSRHGGRGSSTFLAAHPELAGVSVVVEGTFNGKAFVFKGAPRADLERTFSPPLVVDASAPNLTVDVDLATWFKSRTGALIDPSTANADGPNAAVVADNIKRSFHAFRDDDRNGHDDDEDRGGRS